MSELASNPDGDTQLIDQLSDELQKHQQQLIETKLVFRDISQNIIIRFDFCTNRSRRDKKAKANPKMLPSNRGV